MSEQKKILFYFCGQPVYEGSEKEKTLKAAAKKGGLINTTIEDAKIINSILNPKKK